MEDPEPIVEGCMLKVDDRPLNSIGHFEFGLPIDADGNDDGVGLDDAIAVAAFSNYLA